MALNKLDYYYYNYINKTQENLTAKHSD